MKHLFRALPLLLLSAFVSFAQAAAPAGPPPASVVVQPVERLKISPTVPVTGTVQARNDVQITLGVEGQLEFVAEPGTQVNKGDVIARIDTVQLELSLAEQEAQAERARAQLRFLDSQLARQRDLASTQALSANELEQTESQRDVAASDLRIAELRVRQLKDQLQRAIVRADFAGVITERMRRAGEDISRGTVVARLVDTRNLEVRVLAPLRYQGRIQTGDTLKLYGFERESHGVVRSITPSMDPRQQALELRIDMQGETQWAVGELVSVAIPLTAATEVLAIPRDALILRQDGNYVFRVSADGTAERIPVVIGDSAGENIAVEGALKAGDQVVVRGGESLTPGQALKILNGSQSATAARVAAKEAMG